MRLFSFISLLLFVFSSCGGNRNEDSSSTNKQESFSSSANEEKFPDDTYCAEVEYYNPDTGTHSSYTLTVFVESNEIKQINFPSGGWMDRDHFSGAELDEDGHANFESDKGYEYEIKVIGSSRNCFTGNVSKAVQCKGITVDNEQCEHMTDNANGLCWQHQDQE